jgi:hypothetical protein
MGFLGFDFINSAGIISKVVLVVNGNYGDEGF